ncbi:DUF1028 domain-containing protein [Celerinatantimonas diazotrophica]|uniref:Putative Ntn-hydrolase superfamily protein n=1 Tax=Celerinatantimonas diazotrophica TaxID=412034 RepID=A0A4R1K1J8_9GAMM|nr:DUF1028 domain-containing protein [Celerinatantimonas diazotrophica]TCK57770.1 putative Ntn-hydrolase superfamily protein [Celerinatantimonas diazotrophica]CAG9298166.1 hypothetical protein CEDIAZO_03361 [Celerinatantimonas diazotrophica]
MTLSLLHFNPATGVAAAITATGGPSVGGYVHHCWKNLGALATQGYYTNPWYADFAKEQLKQGVSSKKIIEQLTKLDREHRYRQCLVIDKQGQSAVLNGAENMPQIHALTLSHVAAAGNLLASGEVIEAMTQSFVGAICANPSEVLSHQQPPEYHPHYESELAHQLISALNQALIQGGDTRGVKSAALRIESPNRAPIDIRVDWASNNVIDHLQDILHHVEADDFQDFLSHLPNDVQV